MCSKVRRCTTSVLISLQAFTRTVLLYVPPVAHLVLCINMATFLLFLVHPTKTFGKLDLARIVTRK